MNILIICRRIRRETLQQFRAAAGAKGKVVVAGTDPFAKAIYEADKWYLLPFDPNQACGEAVLEICRSEDIHCAVALEQHCEVLEKINGEAISLCTSEEAIARCFPGQNGLPEAYRIETTEAKHSPIWRIYRTIVKLLPQEFKTQVSLLPDYLTTYQKNKHAIRSANRQIVYLLDSPAHNNLGDHAIAYAQRKFIEKVLPDALILELPIELVDMHLSFIRKHIRPGDLLCMIGGGNFGDAYLMHEYSKRKVCRMFPDNCVIVFPQTINYSDTPQGHSELAMTQEALRSHRKLTITARDEISHQRAKRWFPEAECILTPDIVLSLPPVKAEVPRKGILCCLRKDLERNAAFSARDVLTQLAAEGYPFTLSDTAGEGRVSLADRSRELERKWREFCGAELVITDRLHGMIFACITSTPCIVLDNYNHKILDFYETWLRDIPTVRFAEKAEQILPLTRELLGQGSIPWNPDHLTIKYAPLLDALRKES